MGLNKKMKALKDENVKLKATSTILFEIVKKDYEGREEELTKRYEEVAKDYTDKLKQAVEKKEAERHE